MATVFDKTAESAVNLNKVNMSEKKSCCRQTRVLTMKNIRVQFRNKGATAAQLLVGVLFIILLLIMDIAVKENNKNNDWYIETRDSTLYDAFEFTPCTPIKGEVCYSIFIYGDSQAEANLGVQVAKILDLPTTENSAGGWKFVNKSTYPDLKDYLFTHLNTSRIGVEFKWPGGGGPSYSNGESSTTLPSSYILHYNGTRNCGDLGIFNCENTERQLLVPLMTAVDSILLRRYALNSPSSKNTARIKASFKDFPHPALSFALDVVQQFGSQFFFMAVSFNFIVQVRNLVSEKQYKLRDAMKQIGMMDSAYWTSWLISSLVTNTISTLLFIIMGSIAQFPFFLINDFLAYFIHFWLTMFAFTCSAFFVSSLVSNERTAINIGLFFFILFFLAGSIATSIFYGSASALTNEYAYDWVRVLFMAIPGCAAPFGFFQGFEQLVTASSSIGAVGMRIGEISNNVFQSKIMQDGSVESPFWSLATTWLWMIGNSAYCLVLAIYFDNALPNSYGRSEGKFFCLKKEFWFGKKKEERRNATEDRTDLQRHIEESMSDTVKKEAERIIDQTWNEDEAPAVQVLGMEIFFSSRSCCGALKMVKAVQGITYGIDNNSVFVLLGHNGAGKTTTINALVGNLRPTNGDAYVFGHSCNTSMRTINQMMGVCPQHDILWEQLTGREHLELFAALRGMPEESIEQHVNERIQDVNLVKAQNVESGTYSGGMKRRLSIAIALLGDPQIVYLDEPTTGMDPVTRRDVWDMIIRAKHGRVIVLTTHSMEEADVLGDRVGIMSHGKIQALGTSLSLKKEYGGGYKMNAIVKSPEYEQKVCDFMTEKLPNSKLENNVDGAMFFKVPEADDEQLVSFFKLVEEKREELGITDFSVGLTTLEEVFLELSKRDQFIVDDPDAVLNAPEAEEIKTFRFPIPEGANPGAVLQIPHPHPQSGQDTISYTVLETDKPGSMVELSYVEKIKKSNILKFQIPPGALKGTVMELERPDGGPKISYTVPAGKKEGDEVEIPYEPEPPKIEEQNRPTYWSYLNALSIKQWQFQKTKSVQCFCIMLMPVFLMLLLLLLNLVFDGIKITTLCGPGITMKNCAEDGYNLTCVKSIFEQTRASNAPALRYGEVQRGFGINGNCGNDAPANAKKKTGVGRGGQASSDVCYEGLEKPMFSSIPFTAPSSAVGIGELSYTRKPDVMDWYNGFRYTMTSSDCQRLFNDNFDYDIACADDKSSDCRLKLNELQLTKTWRDANPKDGSEGSSGGAGGGRGFTSFLSGCLPENINSRRRLAEFRPSDENIKRYDDLVSEKEVCEGKWLLTVSERLAAQPILTTTTSKKAGTLGNFTTAAIADEGYSTIQTAVLNNAWTYLSLNNRDDDCRLNDAPKDAFDHTSLNDICNSTVLMVRKGNTMVTMKSQHNSSTCNKCFGAALGSLANPMYVQTIPEFTMEMFLMLTVMSQGINMGLSSSSLAFFAVNVFRQNSWRKWSTSICLVNDINDLYVAGKITGSQTAAANNMWDQFWPGFYQGIMLGFDSTSVAKGKTAWKSFCAMDTDIDAIRGLTFKKEASGSKINEVLLKQWGGENVETAYMKEAAPRDVVGYRHHYYNTQTMAYDFSAFNTDTGEFEFTAFFNNSATDDDKTGNWLAISELITTAIYDSMLGKNKKPTMQLQPFPTQFKCERDKWLAGKDFNCDSLLVGFLRVSVVDFILTTFLPIILMLMIYPTVTAIVYEKQQKLRMIMKMQGLPMPVYYVVMYALHYFMYFVICLLMTIVGYLAGIKFFTIHNLGIVWLFFLLWGHLMLAFAFFLSAFLSRMRTAMAVTFLVILIMWQCGGTLFQQFLTNPNTTEESYIPLMFLPPWVMFRWVYWFGLAGAFGQAIGPDNWAVLGGGVLPRMCWVMILEWFIFMGLYWYLENVMVLGHGTAKSCCFFLSSHYWGCGNKMIKANKVADAEDERILNTVPQKVKDEHKKWHEKTFKNETNHEWSRPHDVQREHERTMRFEEMKDGKDPRVRICSMHKVFTNPDPKKEKMAVKCVSFGVNKKECFGLLGHNGAGKTTLLNILTGLYPATSGTAFVDNLRLDRDLSEIYAKMGVCPQHDILWGSLTGRMHVSFFGRLKGMNGKVLNDHVEQILQSVNLSVAGDRKAMGYSGGMKRRLSVANSLVGNPDVVYME
jgi:ABC-type multidrug transport system ATPase subunit